VVGLKEKEILYKDYKKGRKPKKMNRYYDKEEIPDTNRKQK